MIIKNFDKFKKIYELNHQSFGFLGVNEPGFGQGAHVGNWGADYGNPSQGVRGTFGDKGDPMSDHLPQKKKNPSFPSVVYDPLNNKYLTSDDIDELLNQYQIISNQNSETPYDFSGNIDSRSIEFIQNYINNKKEDN